jgi:hypothetical protein
MKLSNTMFSCVIVFYKYNIPQDISKLIYYFISDKSAQFIIDKWFSFIVIHNTNLTCIVNNLTIKQSPLYRYFYYDIISDPNVYNTFKICIKYIKPSISSKDWWIQRLHYVLNGLYYNIQNNTHLFSFRNKILNIMYKFEYLNL